jgi:hypothetical protein
VLFVDVLRKLLLLEATYSAAVDDGLELNKQKERPSVYTPGPVTE